MLCVGNVVIQWSGWVEVDGFVLVNQIRKAQRCVDELFAFANRWRLRAVFSRSDVVTLMAVGGIEMKEFIYLGSEYMKW